MFNRKTRLIQIDGYIYEIPQDEYYDLLKNFTAQSCNEEGSVEYYNAGVRLSRYKESIEKSSKKPKYIVDANLTTI